MKRKLFLFAVAGCAAACFAELPVVPWLWDDSRHEADVKTSCASANALAAVERFATGSWTSVDFYGFRSAPKPGLLLFVR